MSRHHQSDPSDLVEPAAIKILGIEFAALTQDELDRLVASSIAARRTVWIGNHNLHSVYLFHKTPSLRAAYERADFVHCDGMSLIAWARCMGYAVSREHRTTYIDWIESLSGQAARSGWRIFHLGGEVESVARAREVIRRRHPGIDIRCHHGFFDATPGSAENETVLRAIAEYRPNLLLVGMSMPRQELWIEQNLDRIDANVILAVGACFDYLSGAIPSPPRWSGRVGLEWLFRLMAEPRRLFRRYLVEPWSLMPLFLRDLGERLRSGSKASTASQR